jgi:hypothetical protein
LHFVLQQQQQQQQQRQHQSGSQGEDRPIVSEAEIPPPSVAPAASLPSEVASLLAPNDAAMYSQQMSEIEAALEEDDEDSPYEMQDSHFSHPKEQETEMPTDYE